MSTITGDDENDDVAEQANVVIESAKECMVRPDGKKTHVFLGYSNKCQCGDKDLNAYRDLVLQ